MQLNSKPLKVVLIAGIIALILIGVSKLIERDHEQGAVAPGQSANQPQTMAKDPFKEYLEKQQQGVLPASIPPQHAVITGNSTTIIPAGSDPFKAFLELQGKAKPEEAVISPFSGGK